MATLYSSDTLHHPGLAVTGRSPRLCSQQRCYPKFHPPVGCGVCTVQYSVSAVLWVISSGFEIPMTLCPYYPHMFRSVNSLCPGTTRTPFIEKVLEERGSSLAKAAKPYPLGRLGSCQDMSNAVLFLASTKSSYITGTSLVVDGGITALGSWAGYAWCNTVEANM